MKLLIPSLVSCILILQACGDGQTNPELKDPAETHPPSEAIPDSTTIRQDSVIVPENGG